MAINTSCEGYIDVDFSSFVVVNSTMKVIDYEQSELGNIPVTIAINAENLYAYVKEEEYCPPNGINVPDPCDSANTLHVPCVTLNEVRVSGPINFVVAAEVLEPTNGRDPVIQSAFTEPGVEVDVDPALQSKIVTAFGSVFINDEILLYLNTLTTQAPDLKVTITKLKVNDHNETADGDNCYEILGTFKIEEKI